MTREEAIRILDPETRREELRKIPVMERIEVDQEACRMAVAALRAQQAPAKLGRSRWEGCEYCKDIPESILKGFCYACGLPLTEEAWAELERRINGGTTD